MRHIFKLVTIFLLISSTLIAQEWTWGIKATGDSQFPYDPSTEIHVDNSGNIVIAGYYQQNLGFDSLSIFTEDDYYSDIFLCRISSNKKVEWLKHLEAGSAYDEDIGLTVDDDQNIYLTGCIDGKIFVSKYDSLGNIIWKQDFENQHFGYGRTITIDQFDNVYIAGGSGWTFFMVKLDYYGNVVWKKDQWMNYSAACELADIEVDALGNIYFTGVFGIDSLLLGDFKQFHDGGWGDDTFFGKLDPLGNFLWVKSSSGRSNSRPQLALTSDNNLFISGSLYSGISFDTIDIDGICCQNPTPYIAKYSTNGNVIWAKGAHTTYESKGTPNDIKVDYDGNLYLTGGYFTCYGTFCTEADSYIEKYDYDGNHQWRKEFKMGGEDYSLSIDLDNYGYCYNVGYNKSMNFIDETNSDQLRSIGVGKLDTDSTTRKRTTRPKINRIQGICENELSDTLFAQGTNIKWYRDPELKEFLASGHSFKPNIDCTDTFYVTQTVNDIESWPKEVIVYKTDFGSEEIKYNKDTLYLENNELFSCQWKYNSEVIENAEFNYILPQKNGIYEIDVSVGNCNTTLSYNFERPNPPVIDSTKFICYNDSVGVLEAEGENIIWYATETYNDTINIGNQFNPDIESNNTYFVRQSINGIASYPQQVEIIFSELKDSVLNYGPDNLFTTYNAGFEYQWYFEGSLIENADSNLYMPQTDGLYSVSMTDSICNKVLSRYFVTQPKINSTRYYVCKEDSMPILSAEGEDIIWTLYNYDSRSFDTLYIGNSFSPKPEVCNQNIYLQRSKEGFSSYPIYLQILKSDFSELNISSSTQSIYVEGNNRYNYSFKWFFKQDTIPFHSGYSAYNPNYGKYKIEISFNDQCDTVLDYNYYPDFDSIVYVCDNSNPELSIGKYSSDISWYADEGLSKQVSYNYNFNPNLNGKDSAFYVAQVRNNEAVWKQKIEIVYPQLDSLSIVANGNLLAVNNPKTYYNYLWTLGNSELDSAKYYCNANKEGEYSVIVSAGNCSIQLFNSYIISSTNGLSEKSKPDIYPNPVKYKLYIHINNTSPDYVFLKLYNSNGALVLNKQYDTPKIELNLGNINPGLYMLELNTRTELFTYKIIKQ